MDKGQCPAHAPWGWIGDIYAGAILTKLPQTEEEWNTIFSLRKISEQQLREASDLGVKMAQAIKNRSLRPVTIENVVGPVSRGIVKLVSRFSRPYETIEGK